MSENEDSIDRKAPRKDFNSTEDLTANAAGGGGMSAQER